MSIAVDILHADSPSLAVVKRVLIVDDDATVALVTQHGLQARLGASVQVEIAPSPGAAWLRCVRGHVDLVIVDPHSRNRASTVLIKALREAYPQIAIVVLTAYDTPRMKAEMRALGVRHYFAKPIELTQLAQGVSQLLH